MCGVSGDKEGIFSESREQNNDLLTMSCRKELMKPKYLDLGTHCLKIVS